jgi:Taurine catabolism dioxygenase TauD, TfdA family
MAQLAEPSMVAQPTIRRLSAALGAEAIDLDLARPLDAATIAMVCAAIQAHHVLCFRDQVLTEAQQIAFSELLGPLEAFPEEDKTKSATTIYNVANVSPAGEHLPATDHRVIFQKVNARFHTDSSYRYIPSFCSLLYGIEVLPTRPRAARPSSPTCSSPMTRCLLHQARPYDMARYRRVFRRTTVAGDGPVLGPYSRAVLAAS